MIARTTPLVGGIKEEAVQRAVRELERTLTLATGRLNELDKRSGVAVDLAQIHAALVALGLISV